MTHRRHRPISKPTLLPFAMSEIDPHSDYTLYDVLENDYKPWEDDFHFEYYGFHIVPQGKGRYHVQYDGHTGQVMTFENDEYDDVLELVADLNDLLLKLNQYDYADDKEGLVEWAGKIMTNDKEKAEKNPELYVHIPDDPPAVME